MIQVLAFVFLFVLFILPGALPGAMVGTAIGLSRGRLRTGLCSGALYGTLGGIIGLHLYLLYVSALPYDENRTPLGAIPVTIKLQPSPHIAWKLDWLLFMIGGGLILAILRTAVFVRRPASPVSKEPDRKEEK